MNISEIIGMRFGRLIVLRTSEKPRDKYYNKNLICQCDCGNISEVSYSNLTRNHTRSCGCLSEETRGQSLKKHNAYDLGGEYGIGYFSNKSCFYFDLDDYDKIKDFYWRLHDSGYACHEFELSGKASRIYMHRLIMQQNNSDIDIDHINHNKSDNRKNNLRNATRKENLYNQAKSIKNTSGIIGVSFIKPENIWMVQIQKDKVRHHLGRFKNKDDAIRTRLIAENDLYGEFAPQRHLFKLYNIGET